MFVAVFRLCNLIPEHASVTERAAQQVFLLCSVRVVGVYCVSVGIISCYLTAYCARVSAEQSRYFSVTFAFQIIFL